jgi:hypothetical protein
VPFDTTSLTVTPTAAEGNATIKVNTTAVVSGAASGAIALVLGDNTITTEVTAQDGTTKKTYTVTVTREHLLAPRHTVSLAKGADAPGRLAAADLPDDAVIASLNPPATDDAGDLAFIAKWTSNNGKVKGAGLFLNNQCFAVVGGDASAIGGAGAKWKSFSDPVVDAGHLACIAKLSTGASAVVCNRTGAALEKIARTGEGATLSPAGAAASDPKYKSFKSVTVAGDNVAYLAQLTVGTGTPKVTALDDAGIWFQGGNNFVALRENQSDGVRAIKTLVSFLPGNGSPGSGRGYFIVPSDGGDPQIAAQVKFTDGTQGLAFQDVDDVPNFTVISRSGDSAGGLDTGATFASYSVPARNRAETTAFLGKLTIGVNVTKADASGIFLGPNGNGKFTTVVRTGGDATPAGAGAKFSLLKDPVLSDDGDIAFPATVKGGTVRGAAMQTLWWQPAGRSVGMFAQGGADAAELPGSKWKTFTSLAIAKDRGPIFVATLTPNASGVWATDFTGTTRLLFRTGGTVDGKTVKSFKLLNATVGSTGVTRSFNDNAKVVWLATFVDKTTAIVRTEVP